MADFNKILTPGDYEKGELNVVIEIPTGSNHKIEWDRKHACFMLDRVEPMAFAKPCNYGFIPQTLDEDGDELDVLMITDQPTIMLSENIGSFIISFPTSTFFVFFFFFPYFLFIRRKVFSLLPLSC